MPSDSEEASLDFSPAALLEILKNFSNHSMIGESSLARTEVVNRILSQMKLVDSHSSRGLVLAMIIRDVIVTQVEKTMDSEESVTWKFLVLSYLAKRKQEGIALELSVGRRSLPRIQQRALGDLATELLPVLAEKPDN